MIGTDLRQSSIRIVRGGRVSMVVVASNARKILIQFGQSGLLPLDPFNPIKKKNF